MELNVFLKRPLILLFILFCSCSTGCNQLHRKDVSPTISAPNSFSDSGGEPLPEKWWESFKDPQLNALIEQAIDKNFTIRSAWDRLSQAEQIAVKSGASLLPEADYQADATRSRNETSNDVTYTTNYSIGLVASYEVDLWARVQSSQQAAILDAEAAKENVNGAAITLSAAIAKTWYQLAEAKEQETVISNQLETNQKILDIITLQFKKGQINAADVFRQRQLVESSRGQFIKIQETIVLLQHQLSILIGKNPQQWWADDKIELFSPPELPEMSVPSDILQRRPDVFSSYKAIQAADLRVATAIADQYPRISISTVTETSANRASNLFDDWLANLAGNLAGPLFDAGLRKAEVERNRAVLSESINEYAQTTLQAVKEVEDAINQEHYQRRYILNLQNQLALANQTFKSARLNYLNGQLDYLRVLESLVSKQSLERNELTARRILVEHRIDLCRSIAGSWEMKRPEQAHIY
jgi:NodT family efflux transporter outer membrane factor (OMF) lipoprotein